MNISGALTKDQIIQLASKGIELVSPFEKNNVQPASIDIRLGDTQIIYDFEKYVLGSDNEFEHHKEVFKKVELDNNRSILISLHEEIHIPDNMLGLVMPRSSITRLGITIQPTYMNPGYQGKMPISIVNNSGKTICIKPMLRVVQLVLFQLSAGVECSYKDIDDAKYKNETAAPSKIYMDKDLESIVDGVIKRKSPSLSKNM